MGKIQIPVNHQPHCTGCLYWRHFTGGGANEYFACYYLLDTNHMRGCSPAACDKKKNMEVTQ